MINGKLIRLRKPEREDVDYALKWLKDEDHPYFPMSDLEVLHKDLREIVLTQIKAPFNYDSNIYLVIENKEGKPIGAVLFY